MNDNKQPRIKILVACHKADSNIRQDDIYMPIQVGKALHPELDLGFQCDNTGDNISEKNGSYCELTALYWAWKNLKDVDYIGLCHYRRYFDFSNSDIREIIPLKKWNPKNDNDNLFKLLSHNQIIASRPNTYPHNVAIDYAIGHYSEDLRVVYSIIDEKFPSYKDAFEKAVLQCNYSCPYNMFVSTWEVFDEYCRFIFPLLEEAEKRISITNYNEYQKRIWGFLAERLINVFFYKKKREGFNIKKLPVMWITDEIKPSSKLHYLANRIRFNISYALSRPLHPSF